MYMRIFNFSHLRLVKQTYFEHFMDAVSYSFMAFKASCYFFVHAFIPDWFEFDGSREIDKLNGILVNKKKAIFG